MDPTQSANRADDRSAGGRADKRNFAELAFAWSLACTGIILGLWIGSCRSSLGEPPIPELQSLPDPQQADRPCSERVALFRSRGEVLELQRRLLDSETHNTILSGVIDESSAAQARERAKLAEILSKHQFRRGVDSLSAPELLEDLASATEEREELRGLARDYILEATRWRTMYGCEVATRRTEGEFRAMWNDLMLLNSKLALNIPQEELGWRTVMLEVLRRQ